jgi:hypothetical protein
MISVFLNLDYLTEHDNLQVDSSPANDMNSLFFMAD